MRADLPMQPGQQSRQQQREQALTDTVLESFARTPDERLREVITALTEHLHALVREVRLTEDEWARTIEFLTATGHITDARRQEFILLSDVLGVSMQTIIVNDTATDATEQTVVGPFFVADAPTVPLGGDIASGASGEPCWVEGTVTGPDGTPIAHAVLDVWEADDEGRYDVQYSDARVAARARLVADDEGRYRFWALTPTPYPIPDDGPVGALLAATARSPMRSPHLHFRVESPEHRTVTTHIFVRGDGLEHDSVFGVRDSLIKDFRRHAAGDPTPDGREVEGTWTDVRFDIVLAGRP